MRDLFKDSYGSLRGKILYAASQAVFYILLARLLGAASFGVFAGLIAFIGFFQPLLGVGMDSILVRDIAREPDRFSVSFARSLIAYALSGLLLFGIAFAINFYIFRNPFPAVLFVLIISGEFLFRIADLGGRAFQGYRRISEASNLWFSVSAAKLIAVLLFWVSSQHTLEIWSVYYIVCAVISAVANLIWAMVTFGLPNFNRESKAIKWGEGLSFSAVYATEKIYFDVDKFMLLKLSTQLVTGVYSAAYYFIKVGYYPVLSVLIAAYPRFFKEGTEGIGKTLRLSFRILKYSALYGIVVGIFLYLIAPLIPIILGPSYNGVVSILRWLSVVPFIQSLYQVQAVALTGADKQKLRSFVQLLAVVINIGVNLWLIPLYSWWGAAIATILSETFMVIVFSTISFWFIMKFKTKSE